MSIFDKKPKSYLAGPFFNPPQKDRISELERLLERVGCNYFSPMTHGGVIKPGDDPRVLDETFAMDHSEIERCDFMLVNLDFLLPTNTKLCLIEQRGDITGAPVHVIKQLYLSDPGSVWEMGAAYQYGKPILGLKTQGSQLNLMLARSCLCVTKSLEDLERVLQIFVSAVIDKDPKIYTSTVALIQSEYKWTGSEAG